MEEKKNNKRLIWLIIILIVLILGLVGYVIYDRILKNNDDVISNNTTTIIQNNDNNEENVLRRDNFVYKLNNKEHHISYVYYYRNSQDYYKNESEDTINFFKEEDIYFYNEVFMKILIDEKEIDNLEYSLYFDKDNLKPEELMSKVEILSSDSIHTIKGDKEYFVFTINYSTQPSLTYSQTNIDPTIVNENGILIYTLEYGDGGEMWVTDETSRFYKKSTMFIIEEDRIYYLEIPKVNSSDNYLVQENYLTINNDKINIIEGDLFKGDGAGQF